MGLTLEIARLHAEVAEVVEGSFRRKQPPEIVGSRRVVKTPEAALGAFHDARDSRQAVPRAANPGEDADTTGTTCGQLARVCWGESGILVEWREGLARRETNEQALSRLGVPTGPAQLK